MGLCYPGSHNLPYEDRCRKEFCHLAQAGTLLGPWYLCCSYCVGSTRHDSPFDHEGPGNQGNLADPHDEGKVAQGGQGIGGASSHLQALMGSHCCPGICGGRAGGSLVSESWIVLC